MTVASRRLAARCRERFVTDPTVLTNTVPTGSAAPTLPEPPMTVDTARVETVVPQGNLGAAAT